MNSRNKKALKIFGLFIMFLVVWHKHFSVKKEQDSKNKYVHQEKTPKFMFLCDNISFKYKYLAKRLSSIYYLEVYN